MSCPEGITDSQTLYSRRPKISAGFGSLGKDFFLALNRKHTDVLKTNVLERSVGKTDSSLLNIAEQSAHLTTVNSWYRQNSAFI